MSFASNNTILEKHYSFMVETAKRLFPGNSLHMDLVQDVYIKLAEEDTTKLNRLDKSNELRRYIYVVIHNQVKHPREQFARMYRREVAMEDVPESHEEMHDEYTSSKDFTRMGRLNEFEQKVFALYVRFDSKSERAADAAKIRRETFRKYINQIKQKLK